MYVYNKRFVLPIDIIRPETLLGQVQELLEDSLVKGESVLRFAIVGVKKRKVIVEASILGEET